MFEQARGIGDVGYALTPWPDALAALDRIGVGDDVRAAGRPCLYGQHRDRGGRPLGYYISPATLAGTIAWLGVGPLERPQEGDIPFWGRGELVGVFSMPRNRAYWFAMITAPRDDTWPDPTAELRRRFGAWAQPVGSLVSHSRAEDLIRIELHDLSPLPRWSGGGPWSSRGAGSLFQHDDRPAAPAPDAGWTRPA